MFIFFFIGVATFQMMFIIYQYAVLKRSEFLYYFLYALLITIFVTATLMPENNPIRWLVTEQCPYLLGRVNVVMAFAMYFHFGRLFTNSKKLYPVFDTIIKLTIYVIYFLALIDILLLLSGYSYERIDRYFQYASLALAAVTIYAVVYMITRRQILTSLLVIGSFFLMIFASIGLIKSLFISHQPVSYEENVMYIEIGIVFEFLFLTYGLIYKTRLIEKENISLMLRQQEEIDKERQRIIADLHDDIGSTLSSISIFSELAGKYYQTKPEQSLEMIGKISKQTKDLMSGIEDIIRSLKPAGHDTSSIQSRVQEYSTQLLSAKGIQCTMNVDAESEAILVHPTSRRHILLIIKEALNNISKYSKASNATIDIHFQDKQLCVLINDDGIGFDMNTIRNGNGLVHMKRRCEEYKGSFRIHSVPGKGTEIDCHIPIASIRHGG